jgi:hypothetical protein
VLPEGVKSRRRIEKAVRVVTILAIVCTCLSLATVFLPSGELTIRQPTATHRAVRSLYELGRSSDQVRAFIDDFRASPAKKVGARALDRLSPHLRGRLGEQAADVREAVAILDGLEDEELDTAGQVMAGVLWTMIGLHVLLVLLLMGTDVGTRRARVVLALVVAVLTAAMAIGVFVALDRIVDAANAEVGRAIFALQTGAYLLPAAALVSLAVVVAVVVTHAAARRGWRPELTSPPTG